jgi:hypothetical protein
VNTDNHELMAVALVEALQRKRLTGGKVDDVEKLLAPYTDTLKDAFASQDEAAHAAATRAVHDLAVAQAVVGFGYGATAHLTTRRSFDELFEQVSFVVREVVTKTQREDNSD